MSRIPEGECDDEESGRRWALQRANTARQIKGKRGQAFLRELLDALESMPEKRLIEGAVARDGMVCTFGALAVRRRVDAGETREVVLADLETVVVNPEDEYGDEPDGYIPMWEWAEEVLNTPSMIAWELVDDNDDDGRICTGYEPETHKPIIVVVTPEMRHARMVRIVRRMLGMQATPDAEDAPWGLP